MINETVQWVILGILVIVCLACYLGFFMFIAWVYDINNEERTREIRELNERELAQKKPEHDIEWLS